MQLIAIKQDQFAQWKQMRKLIYPTLDDAYDDAEMAQIIYHDKWFCYFIVDKNGQIMGMVELSARNIVDDCLTSPVAYLEGLFLKQQYRGQGLGKQVMQMIMQWCRQQGFSELATDAELSNVSAQQFYQALGFEETGRVVE